MKELYRHKKTGYVYDTLTEIAKIHSSYYPEVEDQFIATDFTVYRNVDHGGIYIRPTKEFWDGRFEKLYLAAEINMISISADVVVTFDDCEAITFPLEVWNKMIFRYMPKRGDFLVFYEDGYQAFSPRMAFLNGYSKITT